MSITLDIDSPTKPWCKTVTYKYITIGNEEVGIEDFLMLAHYVLTNTDLEPDDPRRQFVRCVQAMHEGEGWNGENSVALRSSVNPIPQRSSQ